VDTIPDPRFPDGDGTGVPGTGVLDLPVVGGSRTNLPTPERLFGGRWPAVSEYMSVVVHKGKAREPASITLFCEAGQLKACLTDKQNERLLFRSGSGVEEILDAFEKALRDPGADWRPSRKARSK
jgi:hypothetical protein